MRTAQWIRLAALAAAGVLAGCASDSTTSPSTNLADANLQVVFDNMAALSTASATATGDQTTLATILPSTCVYGAGSQTFTCPERVQHVGTNVFHIQSMFSLLDVSGGSQSAFDAATTDGLRLVVASHDTLTAPPAGNFPGGTYTVTRTDDRTVTGLLSPTRTLNGVGTSTSSLLGITEFDTTRAVVLPRRGSSDVLPTSGTIVVVGGSSALGFAARTTLTFVGSNSFTLTNSSGATTTCSMAAVTRKVTCG